MAVPGASQKTVSDLVPGVIEALQQRTDVSDIAPKYIKKALVEITESYPFEELRRIGPLTAFSTTQADPSLYSVRQFVNDADDLTSVEVWTIFIDFPSNRVK